MSLIDRSQGSNKRNYLKKKTVKPRAGGTQPDLIQHWPINYVLLLCNDNIGSCAVLFYH